MSMKRKLLKLTFALFAAMVCSSVNAQEPATSGDCGENATWSFEGETLTISGTGAITTYSTTKPDDYPWYPLADDINTVIIEEGITNVPDWAFAMYGNLTSVSLPSTLKTIGNSSLEECGFSHIYLPEGLETIGDYAFLMGALTVVCLPSTVTSIGTVAFQGNEYLTSVGCYASTPPTLGENAFNECLIETVYVPSAIIDDYKDADGWKDFGDMIQSPSGQCGDNATWSFEMATHTLTIEGTGAINDHSGWESASMGGTGGGFNPDNNIGYPCGIERVIIGEGIEEIPESAFYMEVGITNVMLPSTLTNIGLEAFGECFNIEKIICNATTPPTLGEDGYNWYVIYGHTDEDTGEPLPIESLTAIYVPAGSEAAYKDAAGWAVYADLIQMPNTKVGDEYWTTFYDADKNYEVDANTTIYKASLTEDPKVVITAIGDNIIRAGNAVILKSTGVPVLTETDEAGAGNFDGNALLGSDGNVNTDANRIYCLAYMNGKLAFYRVAGGVPVPAGKAYLHLEAGARGFYVIEEDGTTSVSEKIKVNSEKFATAEWYDLQGRRVLYPKKGLYIMNGKKVIIK